MAKKIKSFTVDEEVYKSLVEMFKKYNVDVSVSLFLNNCLRDLLGYLLAIEGELQSGNYKVPMDYIINEQVKGHSISIPDAERDPEYPEASSHMELHLESWEDNYDAEKKGIPTELYDYVEKGNYALSTDKKYLIQKGTGKKYVVTNRGLMEIIDTKA